MRDELKWTLFVGGATVLASWLTRRTLEEAWERALGEPPPEDPDLTESGLLTVVGWSMAVAGAAGLARVLARKGAATAWKRATSEEPPVAA